MYFLSGAVGIFCPERVFSFVLRLMSDEHLADSEPVISFSDRLEIIACFFLLICLSCGTSSYFVINFYILFY